MQVVYTASATATGDARNGHVRSVDGVIDTDLAVPKEMGGPGGALPNPEELFAAGYAACFHSAIKSVARREKIDVTDSAVTVDVGHRPQRRRRPRPHRRHRGRAPRRRRSHRPELMDAAHLVCPYSNATRGNVEVTLTIA